MPFEEVSLALNKKLVEFAVMPTIKEAKFRIVKIEDLPVKRPQKTEYWISMLKSVPKGSALISTEKDLGVSIGTVKSKLSEYTKKGWIPKGYHSVQKTTPSGVEIYILHEGDTKEKEAE